MTASHDFEHLCNVAKDRFEDWRELQAMHGITGLWWTDHRMHFLGEVAAEHGLSTRSLLNSALARGL